LSGGKGRDYRVGAERGGGVRLKVKLRVGLIVGETDVRTTF